MTQPLYPLDSTPEDSSGAELLPFQDVRWGSPPPPRQSMDYQAARARCRSSTFLVEGLVKTNSVVSIVGKPGSFKKFLALDLRRTAPVNGALWSMSRPKAIRKRSWIASTRGRKQRPGN